MPRPQCCRRIQGRPCATSFRPTGVLESSLEAVRITLDELESIRLADLEGLYQLEASERMGVSRATFGRILDAAHRKIAEALVHGRTLEFVEGTVQCALPRPCENCHGNTDIEQPCPRCCLASHPTGDEQPGEPVSRCRRSRR